MAVELGTGHKAVTTFEDWYVNRGEDPRTGELEFRDIAPCGMQLYAQFEKYRSEHSARVANYPKYEMMADAEVVSKKPDLPNVSSGDIAGMVRRMARNIVQHTPNVEIVSVLSDDKPKGILADYILRTKVLREELNSNEMQQHLFASVMSAATLGFDAVCPVLVQRGDGTWVMEYDSIYYQDVFPEPGVKDVRKAPEVFVRRYLTKGEVQQLIRANTRGWDIAALRRLLKHNPPAKKRESLSQQERKHRTSPSGYEIITWYNSYGDPFLTFDARHKTLLRIEKNLHPAKEHPVRFLVLEKDPQQPLGHSLISLVFGRQEFQDLMLNGAMKLWYKNINPTLLGYGTGLNGVPNMSPGSYMDIPNPNAKIEAFEVNTQTLLQYGSISEQNQGNMINLTGAADQQMAASAGSGMSATPQGVNAQEAMVDITTNNYQKAVESFFSQYCSHALTTYFQEMKGAKFMTMTAATRKELLDAGVPAEMFDEDGHLRMDMSEMAVEYHVRCVPGTLVEMEQEKQLRALSEIFVPLSQALPAIAAAQDQEMLTSAAKAMQFIIAKSIELSGSTHATELSKLMLGSQSPAEEAQVAGAERLESELGEVVSSVSETNASMADAIVQLQDQVSTLAAMNNELFQHLGITSGPNEAESATVQEPSSIS